MIILECEDCGYQTRYCNECYFCQRCAGEMIRKDILDDMKNKKEKEHGKSRKNDRD